MVRGWCQGPLEGGQCTNSRKGGVAALSWPGGMCPVCAEPRCRAHCECGRAGLATGRGAARGSLASSGAVAVPAPSAAAAAAPPAAPVAAPASLAASSVAPAAARRERSRSRRGGGRSAAEEGRRMERGPMALRFLGQWRNVPIEERPMPPRGDADGGIVPGRNWGEALVMGERQTRELLRVEPSGYHSSVRLTLYLRWAQGELRQLDDERRRRREEQRAGLELGGRILDFVGRGP